jgi:hypothetical protein
MGLADDGSLVSEKPYTSICNLQVSLVYLQDGSCRWTNRPLFETRWVSKPICDCKPQTVGNTKQEMDENNFYNIFFNFVVYFCNHKKQLFFYITFIVFYFIEGLLVLFGFIFFFVFFFFVFFFFVFFFFLAQEEEENEEERTGEDGTGEDGTGEDGIWFFCFDNNKLKYINCFDALFTRNIL